mmetsp:Transcript_81024/g.146255  ORF Transcript_81024/g.146255 Transcript_81024/m.146255 type:complete len:134 (-) Transcript_81024:145-546(-)
MKSTDLIENLNLTTDALWSGVNCCLKDEWPVSQQVQLHLPWPNQRCFDQAQMCSQLKKGTCKGKLLVQCRYAYIRRAHQDKLLIWMPRRRRCSAAPSRSLLELPVAVSGRRGASDSARKNQAGKAVASEARIY